MAIVYPLSLPAKPMPRRSKITMANASGITRSPMTYERQAFFWGGAAWKIQIEYPPMRRAFAEQLIGIMGQLKGAYGTFLAGDWDGRNPRGVGTGVPLVNGAGQSGDSLVTDGWTHNVNAIVAVGDYLQITAGGQQRLFKALADANSDGSGNATILVWPPISGNRVPADNAAITLVNTTTVFALDTDFDWDADQVSTYGCGFSATEVP